MPHKQDDTTQQLSLLWFSRNEIIKNKNIKKKNSLSCGQKLLLYFRRPGKKSSEV